MPQALLEKTSPPAPERLARINVDEYHQMLKAGILHDGDPIELIDGLLIFKDRGERGGKRMGIGGKHNLVVQLLWALNLRLQPFDCHLQAQGPIRLPPFNEPEPDGLIVRRGLRDLADRVPEAKDAVAVIEVSDSSLAYDRSVKLSIYARCGIPQYVIINIPDAQIEVYEQPVEDELRYARQTIVKAGDTLRLKLSPDQTLDVPAQQLLP